MYELISSSSAPNPNSLRGESEQGEDGQDHPERSWVGDRRGQARLRITALQGFNFQIHLRRVEESRTCQQHSSANQKDQWNHCRGNGMY